MAVTFTFSEDHRDAWGNQFVRTGTLTATGAATAGGDVLDADVLDLNVINSVIFHDASNSAGYVPTWDKSTGKVKFLIGNYDATDGPLITAGTATVTGTVQVSVLGY